MSSDIPFPSFTTVMASQLPMTQHRSLRRFRYHPYAWRPPPQYLESSYTYQFQQPTIAQNMAEDDGAANRDNDPNERFRLVAAVVDVIRMLRDSLYRLFINRGTD